MNIMLAAIDYSDFTAEIVLIGAALVALGAVVAVPAYGVKAIPMGLRFIGKIWNAIAGR